MYHIALSVRFLQFYTHLALFPIRSGCVALQRPTLHFEVAMTSFSPPGSVSSPSPSRFWATSMLDTFVSLRRHDNIGSRRTKALVGWFSVDTFYSRLMNSTTVGAAGTQQRYSEIITFHTSPNCKHRSIIAHAIRVALTRAIP